MITKLGLICAVVLTWCPGVWAVTAVISWTPSPESDVVKYRLYRDNGTPCTTNSSLRAEILAPNTTFVDQGLDGSKYYCVTAVDAVGQESVVSSTATATYPTSAPVECPQ